MIGLTIAAALQAAPVAPAPAMLAQVMPAQVMPAVNWRVAPVTQGMWSWRPLPGGSEAIFQDYRGPQLAIRCSIAARTVAIVRTGAMNGAPVMVRTTSSERSLASGGLVSARDPLLDAIAFSRGRISVEVAGAQRLVIPAWPEAARAVEDCRK